MDIDVAKRKFIENVTGMKFEDFAQVMKTKEELEEKMKAEANYTAEKAGDSLRSVLSKINSYPNGGAT